LIFEVKRTTAADHRKILADVAHAGIKPDRAEWAMSARI